MSRRNSGSGIIATIIVVGILLFAGMIIDACEPKCTKSGCDNKQAEGSSYCYLHKPSYRSNSYKSYSSSYSSGSSSSKNSSTSYKASSSSSKNKYTYSNPYSSYDEGYEDVYEDDDYDWDRYWSDSDYADGVDDAMDDLDW